MKKDLLLILLAALLSTALAFVSCGDTDSGDPTSPPASPVALSGTIAQTVVAEAGTLAQWVGDVGLKTTTDYDDSPSDAKTFTVSYNNATATITLDQDYTNADGLLAAINTLVNPIGLDATWATNNLQLDAQDKTGSGNIVVGGTDYAIVVADPESPTTDTAGVAEEFETYTITISGDKALAAKTVVLVIDAGTSNTTGTFDVPVDTTAAQLAALIEAEINDSTPSDLYILLSSNYTTTVSGKVVTITADASSTANTYTNTLTGF
jgi:hypothetical protein